MWRLEQSTGKTNTIARIFDNYRTAIANIEEHIIPDVEQLIKLHELKLRTSKQ